MDPSNDQHGGEERRFSSGSAAGAVRVEAESLCTVFTLLDVKASGNIPREKVPLALRMLGMPLTRREVEQALRTADPLQHGQLSFERFEQLVSSLTDKAREVSTDDLVNAMKELGDVRGDAGEEPSSVSLEALEYNLKNFGDCLDSNEVTFLRELVDTSFTGTVNPQKASALLLDGIFGSEETAASGGKRGDISDWL